MSASPRQCRGRLPPAHSQDGVGHVVSDRLAVFAREEVLRAVTLAMLEEDNRQRRCGVGRLVVEEGKVDRLRAEVYAKRVVLGAHRFDDGEVAAGPHPAPVLRRGRHVGAVDAQRDGVD